MSNEIGRSDKLWQNVDIRRILLNVQKEFNNVCYAVENIKIVIWNYAPMHGGFWLDKLSLKFSFHSINKPCDSNSQGNLSCFANLIYDWKNIFVFKK